MKKQKSPKKKAKRPASGSPHRLDAARDPGAVPRQRLEKDQIAVIHSSEIDPDPITDAYEAYAEEPPFSTVPLQSPHRRPNEEYKRKGGAPSAKR